MRTEKLISVSSTDKTFVTGDWVKCNCLTWGYSRFFSFFVGEHKAPKDTVLAHAIYLKAAVVCSYHF